MRNVVNVNGSHKHYLSKHNLFHWLKKGMMSEVESKQNKTKKKRS